MDAMGKMELKYTIGKMMSTQLQYMIGYVSPAFWSPNLLGKHILSYTPKHLAPFFKVAAGKSEIFEVKNQHPK